MASARQPSRLRSALIAPVSVAVAVVLMAAAVRGAGDYRPPVPLGLDLYLPVPEDNPLTREKVELGERLFFDARLSRDGSVACVSCHLPERAFSDSLPVGVGIEGRRGERNAPALLNLAWAGSLFRDGSAASLEEQALHPIHSPAEMDLPLAQLEARLARDPTYRRAFERAFGAATADNVARAIASYVRTILAGDAPFDRYLAGERGALSEGERRGFRLFTGKASCAMCHLGPTLSDDEFHATGAAARSGDPGRYGVTGRDEDLGRFRTPTLREIARTAPYMHDGSLATLDEVVEFYDGGGLPHPNLSREIRPLGLTEGEKADLVAYLRALSGRVFAGVR